MPRFTRVRLVAAVVALLAAPSVAGCGGSEGAKQESVPAPTPIAKLDTASMRLARVDFCGLVSDEAIRSALGNGIGSQDSWDNGRSTDVGDDTKDVVHEYGCSWSGGGSTASAWVFARPLTEKYAKAVIAKTSQRQRCEPKKGPKFGTPSQFQWCTMPNGDKRARLAGLFQDTWLTCQVERPKTASDAALRKAAEAWCVEVASVTNTAS